MTDLAYHYTKTIQELQYEIRRLQEQADHECEERRRAERKEKQWRDDYFRGRRALDEVRMHNKVEARLGMRRTGSERRILERKIASLQEEVNEQSAHNSALQSVYLLAMENHLKAQAALTKSENRNAELQTRLQEEEERHRQEVEKIAKELEEQERRADALEEELSFSSLKYTFTVTPFLRTLRKSTQ